jgi:transcriptional regulator with XRE-family HTH domain
MLSQFNILSLTDKQILEEIGASIKTKRINMRLTQKEVAVKAGISVYTISRAESGETISLETFVAILRVLSRLHDLYHFFLRPEPIAPDIIFKLQNSNPKRVKKSKKIK